MKKTLFTVFAAMLAATALFAQTPNEILDKMDKELSRSDVEGSSVIMDLKLPIIGTYPTTIYTHGEKMKTVTEIGDERLTTWSDGKTNWSYDQEKNEITITNASASDNSSAESNMNLISNATKGYDAKLKKETADAWYFKLTKSKSNKNKDDAKNMDLVVSKATYLPLSLSTKASGVTITLRDYALGVSEKDVTFNPEDYPKAKIIDNR